MATRPAGRRVSGRHAQLGGTCESGAVRVREEYLPWLASRLTRARVLVNVVGFTVEEYGDVVAELDGSPGITGFELNLSCPNTSAGGIEFGADPACVHRIVSLCRSAYPAAADRQAFTGAAGHRGHGSGRARCRSRCDRAVNTMPGLLFGGNGSARLGNGNGGVSGPGLLPVGVLAVARVVERIGATPVIGVGGVRSADDVRQYLKVGAALVAIGTAALADPRLPERIVADLERGSG